MKPDNFPSNKAVTKKVWTRSLSPTRDPVNPVSIGLKFIKHLDDNPGAKYDDIATAEQITKARVCQMIALVKKLPVEITDYLINTTDTKILHHFTERKLRPLTLMASDKDKIKTFKGMKKYLKS